MSQWDDVVRDNQARERQARLARDRAHAESIARQARADALKAAPVTNAHDQTTTRGGPRVHTAKDWRTGETFTYVRPGNRKLTDWELRGTDDRRLDAATVVVGGRNSYLREGTRLGGSGTNPGKDYLRARRTPRRIADPTGDAATPRERKAASPDTAANQYRAKLHKRRGGARGMDPDAIARTIASIKRAKV